MVVYGIISGVKSQLYMKNKLLNLIENMKSWNWVVIFALLIALVYFWGLLTDFGINSNDPRNYWVEGIDYPEQDWSGYIH